MGAGGGKLSAQAPAWALSAEKTVGPGALSMRQTLSLRAFWRKEYRDPSPVTPQSRSLIWTSGPSATGDGAASVSVGISAARGSGEEGFVGAKEVPAMGSRGENHGYAADSCSPLPGGSQAPSTCLHGLREKVPGEQAQPAAQPARWWKG